MPKVLLTVRGPGCPAAALGSPNQPCPETKGCKPAPMYPCTCIVFPLRVRLAQGRQHYPTYRPNAGRLKGLTFRVAHNGQPQGQTHANPEDSLACEGRGHPAFAPRFLDAPLLKFVAVYAPESNAPQHREVLGRAVLAASLSGPSTRPNFGRYRLGEIRRAPGRLA